MVLMVGEGSKVKFHVLTQLSVDAIAQVQTNGYVVLP